MSEPSNSDLLAELTALRRQLDRLVQHIPTLARVVDNADLKRRETEKDRRRKADAARMAKGRA